MRGERGPTGTPDRRSGEPAGFPPGPVSEMMTLMGPAHDPIDAKVLTLLSSQLDDTVVASIVGAYRSQLSMRADALRESVPAGGIPLRDAAHSLTASSLTIGATRLGTLCRDVEGAVERHDDDRAAELAAKALDELVDVADALTRSPWAGDAG